MNSNKETFRNKKEFHSKKVNLSFEEKIMQLIELQKIGLELKKSAGREIKPYEIVWEIKR